ncbi:MAG TPA: NADH-quinone oxidoreductase subunit J [Nitrospirota bacterium]|nr:NADH-quinone oxidoreductase subunit J [Nitrospirota bacterium]
MNPLFYISAIIAVVSTFMVITRKSTVHALLYLIVSLLAVSLIFFSLGAPFVAALEVIIYAGAIMVLFVFVIMMLNLSAQAAKQESEWLTPGIWIGPSVLVTLLAAELIYIFTTDRIRLYVPIIIGPKQVGIALFGPYVLGVELASVLLLAGLIGAYHLGRPHKH